MIKYLIALCLISNVAFANDDKIIQEINESMNNINYLLTEYEINGADYSMSFDYHVGYLNGQLTAYKAVLDKMKASNP